MSEDWAPSKRELLDALRRGGDEVLSSLRALPPEHFEQGRYENGWNGRQILAHIASIEWSYPRLLDIAREAATPREQAGDLPTRSMRGGNDAYNDRQVAKRAHASVAELLDEFAVNRAATIAAVEVADEALYGTPIRSAGGVTGPLARVIYRVAVEHPVGHARDIAGGGG